MERLDAVDLEGVDVLCIIAIGKAASLSRSHPVIALAERELVIEEPVGEIGLEDAEVVYSGDRALRNGRLNRV
jgi:hypothetical protein